MAKAMKMKKWFYAILIMVLVLSGVAVSGSGLIISTPEPVFSQAPEPQCVCAECGYRCGSGHAEVAATGQSNIGAGKGQKQSRRPMSAALLFVKWRRL